MDKVILLINRLTKLPDYLLGKTVELKMNGNQLQIDSGLVSGGTLKTLSVEFFHHTYTTKS